MKDQELRYINDAILASHKLCEALGNVARSRRERGDSEGDVLDAIDIEETLQKGYRDAMRHRTAQLVEDEQGPLVARTLRFADERGAA